MGQLTNLYVSQSFQGLLKMTDSTNGLTSTLQTVQTGDGDNSPLQMSLTAVNISGSFFINNVPISSSAGTSGTSGTSGVNGTSGTSGVAGSSGTSGTSGLAGSSGTSGTSGVSGSGGTSGTSGTSGGTGSSGTSGIDGSSGTSGTSGQAGSSGTSGTSGGTGSSGTSGTSGVDGTSGTSGISPSLVGVITTGSITSTQVITGSLNLPDVIISGSLIGGVVNGGQIDIFSEAFNSGSVKMNISASNAISQSNIIFGGLTGPAAAGLTGSIVISGSNNIIMSGPRPNTLVTAGTYGYVGGNGNIFNGQSTLTTSSVLRPNMTNNYNNGGIQMIFDTGTQSQPVIANNYNVGNLSLTHRSGSATITTNLVLGQLNSFASQSFISASVNTPLAQQNLIAGTLNLGHTSSSIQLLGNVINGNAMGIRNEFSSSFSTATNLVNVQRNNLLGNNVQIFVTGSPSSADARNISDNLIGGINTIVTSSHNGSNNAHLHGTIVFGSGLVVSASNPVNTGGSAFVGRFNDTGSLHNSNNIVFAVGTGTAAGSRRTGLSIDTGSNAVFSGSLTTIGTSVISGSNVVTSDRTFVIHSGSMRMYNESGSLRIADGTNQAQLFFNPTRKVGFFLGQSNMDQVDTQFGITSTSTDNYTFGGNFNNFRTGSNNLMLGNTNINLRSGSNNVILAKVSSHTTGSNNLILGSMMGIDEAQNYFNLQLPSDTVPIMFKSGSAPLNISGSLQIASGSGTNDLFMYGHKMFNVGAFQSDQTQSGSANVSQSITYTATDYSNGVSLVSGSRLTVANAGVYNIQFSVQIDRVSGSGTDTIHIWLKRNGTNVTNSSGTITISGNATQAKTVSSWNYVTDAAASDYFELCWQTSNTDIQLINVVATGNIPGTPSVIVTVTQVR